jgi:WD40 repeat protein
VHSYTLHLAAYSPRHKSYALDPKSGNDSLLRLFEAERRSVIAKALLKSPATSIVMSGRESIAAVGQADGTVSVIKIPSLEVEYSARIGRQSWRSAAFSPGGRHLALGGSGCLLIMEREEGGSREWRAAGKTSCESCATIDWSCDGSALRTCGGEDEVTVRYWKLLQDGVPVPCLRAHANVAWATRRGIVGWDVRGAAEASSGGLQVSDGVG